MAISSIDNSVKNDTENLKIQSKVQSQSDINKVNGNAKAVKDSLIISDKAKELASKQYETKINEEQIESQSLKLKELE